MTMRVTGMPVLKLGDSGPLVGVWKMVLATFLGGNHNTLRGRGHTFLDAALQETAAFQKRSGLKVTGQVDEDTWSKAFGELSRQTTHDNQWGRNPKFIAMLQALGPDVVMPPAE